MITNTNTINQKQKKHIDKSFSNLLTLIQELELAIALSPALPSSNSKKLQHALTNLLKQI
jgi:hypothetical protein